MRRALAVMVIVLAAAGAAQAQNVGDGDFDTTLPEEDESYLDEAGEPADAPANEAPANGTPSEEPPSPVEENDEPTLTDADFDTSLPPASEDYLGQPGPAVEPEPSLSDDDFDVSVPPLDEGYLDEPTPTPTRPSPSFPPAFPPEAPTPGPSAWLAIAAVGLAALLVRRTFYS